jgi:hypothetical protein
MSIPRNLGNFADNVNVNGKVEVTGINATGTPLSTTALFGNGTWQSVSVTPAGVSDQNNTSTGYFDLPSGTTAQRPASPTDGMIRFNTTLGYNEWYSSAQSSWFPFYQSPSFIADILLVGAGGGGGGTGFNGGGGGGAGGYITQQITFAGGTTYPIVLGAGGTNGNGYGTNGVSTTFFGLTAVGGGGGGGNGSTVPNGSAGGSGGGRGRDQTTAAGGAGTAGQGFAGGGAGGNSCSSGGGGGGASQVGYTGGSDCGTARTGNLSRGGDGYSWLDSVYYAGGGGGSWEGISTNLPPGGLGGGGVGTGTANGQNAGSGVAYTGGGGGGGQGSALAGNGGSGIVIVRYNGIPRATGGTITQANGITTHTFTSSGSFVVTA